MYPIINEDDYNFFLYLKEFGEFGKSVKNNEAEINDTFSQRQTFDNDCTLGPFNKLYHISECSHPMTAWK